MEHKQTPSLAAANKITKVKRKNTKQQSKHGSRIYQKKSFGDTKNVLEIYDVNAIPQVSF